MRIDFSETRGRLAQLERSFERKLKEKNQEALESYQAWENRSGENQLYLLKHVIEVVLKNAIIMPIIYSMVIPIVIFDVSVFLYQHIVFRVCGIPIVRRKDYFVIDRHLLGYLNPLQKFNCVYCGYGNGVAAYGKEIIARTEQYWCPIKHATSVKDPHDHYRNFFEYGDAEGYRENLSAVMLKYDDESR